MESGSEFLFGFTQRLIGPVALGHIAGGGKDALYQKFNASQQAAIEEQAAAETARLDAEEARLQESFDRKRISAREYEQQLAKLRQQRERGEAETQKKTQALQRQADIVQRARSLFQIFTNTATAVTAALASGPLGVGLVPFIKALGLLQAATVLATPLPKYAKGVSRVPLGKNPPGAWASPWRWRRYGSVRWRG